MAMSFRHQRVSLLLEHMCLAGYEYQNGLYIEGDHLYLVFGQNCYGLEEISIRFCPLLYPTKGDLYILYALPGGGVILLVPRYMSNVIIYPLW